MGELLNRVLLTLKHTQQRPERRGSDWYCRAVQCSLHPAEVDSLPQLFSRLYAAFHCREPPPARPFLRLSSCWPSLTPRTLCCVLSLLPQWKLSEIVIQRRSTLRFNYSAAFMQRSIVASLLLHDPSSACLLVGLASHHAHCAVCSDCSVQCSFHPAEVDTPPQLFSRLYAAFHCREPFFCTTLPPPARPFLRLTSC
ncbi:hypothetical protein J6590_001527 [Homalodisca vitripennis]|nr:hypothetical protein J6590_001527 [Homalodisca vitripennis]